MRTYFFSCAFPVSTLSDRSRLKTVVLSILVLVKLLVQEVFDCDVSNNNARCNSFEVAAELLESYDGSPTSNLPQHWKMNSCHQAECHTVMSVGGSYDTLGCSLFLHPTSLVYLKSRSKFCIHNYGFVKIRFTSSSTSAVPGTPAMGANIF